MTLQAHGGNLSQLKQIIPVPDTVIDFSVNCHPFGPPPEALDAARAALTEAAVGRYPEPDAGPLLNALARHHSLPPDALIAGNGATELIDLIPRALKLRNALLVAPAFGEYGAATVRAGGRLITVPRDALDRFPCEGVVAAIARQRPNLVWLCSPNNPTGERISDTDLSAVLDAAQEIGSRVVLDESFVEYDQAGSRIDWIARHPHLMVLRGFTKFYALAGLRVGYLAADPGLIRILSAARPPWSVNHVASAAAIACLGLDGYQQQQALRMAQLRTAFAMGLAQRGLTPLPSDANFLLCHLPHSIEAEPLFRGLLADGFLIRHCQSFGLSHHIRLRVHTPEHNRAFGSALVKRLNTPLKTPPG